jgi:hypothetical protein
MRVRLGCFALKQRGILFMETEFKEVEFKEVYVNDRLKLEVDGPVGTLSRCALAGRGNVHDAVITWQDGTESHRMIGGMAIVYREVKSEEPAGDGKVDYSDELSADEQVTAEEQITAMIFDNPEVKVSEEIAQQLGREILYTVLREFRRDLFIDYPGESR